MTFNDLEGHTILCHPASLRLRHSASSSVAWKRIFLPRHYLNISQLRSPDFVLYFDFEKCSWSNFTHQWHSNNVHLIIMIMIIDENVFVCLKIGRLPSSTSYSTSSFWSTSSSGRWSAVVKLVLTKNWFGPARPGLVRFKGWQQLLRPTYRWPYDRSIRRTFIDLYIYSIETFTRLQICKLSYKSFLRCRFVNNRTNKVQIIITTTTTTTTTTVRICAQQS